MSLRDCLIAVTTIQSIQDVLASKNNELLAEMHEAAEETLRDDRGDYDDLDDDERQEFKDELHATKQQLRLFLASDTPPDTEPGCWLGVVDRVIEREGLEVELPIEFNKGYKHVYCWDPYRKLVGSRLSDSARAALAHLANGRPFRGKNVEFDGCLYAWLTTDELQALHCSLRTITAGDVGNDDLVEFHTDLVNALAAMIENGCECVLTAS